MSCWCKHGFLTDDRLNIFINSVNLVFFTGYIIAFAYYQQKRVCLLAKLKLIDYVIKFL